MPPTGTALPAGPFSFSWFARRPWQNASIALGVGIFAFDRFMLIFAAAQFPVAGDIQILAIDLAFLLEVLAQRAHAAEFAGGPDAGAAR